MTHTPGPWQHEYHDGRGEGYILGPDGQAVVIGGRSDWGVMRGVLAPDDARLIAAAPDLLEALTSILSEWHVRGDGRVDSATADAALAAIAKATEKVSG